MHIFQYKILVRPEAEPVEANVTEAALLNEGSTSSTSIIKKKRK